MSASEKKKDTPSGERVLLNPEEWEEPEGRKVIGEFHKENKSRRLGVDADLERFEEHWRQKGCVNIQSEYHKRGAPYVEEADRRETNGKNVEAEDEPESVPSAQKAPPVKEAPEPRSDRPINFASIEIISYALFRAIFGNGVRFPLKKEGVIDADVTIRGKDIIINTNQFYANIPDLKVWQITYTHQGKPIFQFGRDVPKGMKIHRWNALVLGFSLWRQTKAAEKAMQRAAKEAARSPQPEAAGEKEG